MGKVIYWTQEEKDYLKIITFGRGYKEIMDTMNDKFDRVFTEKQISSAIKRYGLNTGRTGHYEKGHTPYNKGTKGISKPNSGSFKPGKQHEQRRDVGSERVNIYGYTEVKVEEPDKWNFKHRILWEQHYGDIPEGYSVIFADGDKSNIKIENLRLISRKQLFMLNKNKLIGKDAAITDAGINLANLLIKMDEINKSKY